MEEIFNSHRILTFCDFPVNLRSCSSVWRWL